MMWVQLLLAKRALQHKPLRWIVRLMLAVGVCLATLTYWWVSSSAIRDLQRQAQELAIDIVILPNVDVSRVDECAAHMKRRPDVASAVLLDSRTVWQLFQQELGVQSAGLTDVASMPTVIKVFLTQETASLQRAKAVQQHVYEMHAEIIERVLLPRDAFQHFDGTMEDLRVARNVGTGVLVFGTLLALAVVIFTISPQIIPRDAQHVIGMKRSGGMLTVGAWAIVVVVIVSGLSHSILVYAAEPLQQAYPWLTDIATIYGA